jgi:hypothetical protein
VIVAALTASGLSIDVFEVTGGELLRVPEQVAILAGVLQKEIHCIDIPVEAAVQRLTWAYWRRWQKASRNHCRPFVTEGLSC